MKQVLVKGGKVHLETVPPPAIGSGMALVRVHYSLISSGTESSFVSSGGTAGVKLSPGAGLFSTRATRSLARTAR